MSTLPRLSSTLDVRFGRCPELDAWLVHFLSENNIEHSIDPLQNASPEQLRFMVALAEGELFVPCSDWMLLHLLEGRLTRELLAEYIRNWRAVRRLCREHLPDGDMRRRIMALLKYKLKRQMNQPVLIPSRQLKQLLTVFLTQSGFSDPYRDVKQKMNRRVEQFLNSSAYVDMVDACPVSPLEGGGLHDLRTRLDLVEVRRLLYLSTWDGLWEEGGEYPAAGAIDAEASAPRPEVDRFLDMLAHRSKRPLKVLMLPSISGGVLVDLLLAKALNRMGHKVIMALKEGFLFREPVLWDLEEDPVLARAFQAARLVDDARVSKNELLRVLATHELVVISDGTRERLNLLRASVTFARAWKEADVVLAKGEKNYRRLILTSHSFTRDIFSWFRDEQGHFQAFYKSRPDWVRTLTEGDIKARAEEIVAAMRQAREAGRKVMFYSAIVGSIPGQTETAVEVLETFVGHLRSRLEDTLIINPAEHVVEGLDADDLMYMWERVQRSGLIDVWRFQTDSDIEKSFELMGRRVPPVWAGKDATYSTGCTKEMHIALDMQARHREMQIIGPSREKFFRRREYGVGRFCDAGIECG